MALCCVRSVRGDALFFAPCRIEEKVGIISYGKDGVKWGASCQESTRKTHPEAKRISIPEYA